ncbi:MAG: citrate synthase [Myxococcales bacterium]|nr:citrate synthase [Myxococcales bacterium]
MSAEFVPGLAGVVAAKSAIGFIDGKQGILRYRGIRIEDLSEHSTFEEVSFLLLFGKLPNADELAGFEADLKAERALDPAILAVLKALPKTTHPMVALQTAVAAMGGVDDHMDVTDAARNVAAAKKLIAVIPSITGTFDRLRKGLAPVQPDNSLGHAANFIYMTTGEVPNDQVARLMDVCLILHAEHGFNASTFTGRVVGATLANPYATMSAAVGSLSGPLHGGANERVLEMLAEIPGVEAVEGWLDDALANKRKIMGLGHRVYKVKDPRATILQGLAADLFAQQGSTPLYDIAHKLETEAEPRVGSRGIYPNVDFYSGLVYQKMGIETDLYTPIFGVARVSGWAAHWLEQLSDNRIYRPTQMYVGETDAKYIPMSDR